VVFGFLPFVVEDVVSRRTGDGEVDAVVGKPGQTNTAITVHDFVVNVMIMLHGLPSWF
jgi:hypothetical protein